MRGARISVYSENGHVDGRGHVTAATENKMADSSTDSDDDKLDVDQIVTPEGGKL